MANLRIPKLLTASTCLLSLNACTPKVSEEAKPNILWIYLEDTSPLMGCYGTEIVPTPNIDKLAENGVVFSNAYMAAPVCSASRSSLITGMMSTTTGTHNHHSSRTEEAAIYLPEHVKTIPEIFKANGYFTFNNGKDDYNFMYDRFDLYSQNYAQHPIYGKSGERLELATLKEKQPFFGQIQMYGGKEIFSSTFKDKIENPVDRSLIELPPYLPNHPAIIEEYANHLDAIQLTDKKLGEIMQKLKAADLLENTIIFFFSDHGMRLTRHKQFLYDGGIHVPLIVSWCKDENKIEDAAQRDDLISGIDIGTSTLALADLDIPNYMEGKAIFADDYKEREFVVSTRDRCDFSIDRIRSVRTKDFKYIKNFKTDRPYLQTSYMDVDEVEFVKVMKQLDNENKLNPVQTQFTGNERPEEELYDLKNDPFETINLAHDSAYKKTLEKQRQRLNNWIKETGDQGQYPESKAGLMFMYGIWGKYTENPEYEILKQEHPEYAGSLFHLKSAGWEKFMK